MSKADTVVHIANRMDENDIPPQPRQPRVKNSFQLELKSRLKERQARGLAADVSTSEESEDDFLKDYRNDSERHQNRPMSAKRRGDHISNWQPGLEDTLRTQDIERLLGSQTRTNLDEEDDEIATTLRNKLSADINIFHRKTPTLKDSLLEHKTPTSPQVSELIREEVSFTRKTPTKSFLKGKSEISNQSGQQSWQPPIFRNVSPSADLRHSPATSQGRHTPSLESSLGPIAEKTPRLKKDRKKSLGQTDESPRSEKPTPRTRSQRSDDSVNATHSSPTLDIFGKSRRDSSLEMEKQLKEKEHGKEQLPKWLTDRNSPTDQKSQGISQHGSVSDRKSPSNTSKRKVSPERRSPANGLLSGEEKVEKKENSRPSVLDRLAEDVSDKPKPKERQSRRSKIPKDEHKEIFDIGEVPTETLQKNMLTDSSSICDSVKEDPRAANRKIGDNGDGQKLKQRTDRQQADDVIHKIYKEQTRSDFRPVNTVRPVSAQAKVQHRPKPRYGLLPGEKSKEPSPLEFSSTQDIREAVYVEWYHKHMQTIKQEQKEKKQKAEEEVQKKKQEEEEKQMEAQQSFRAWEEKKKKFLTKEKARQQEEEQQRKEKEHEEKENRTTVAEMSFKSWKEKKEEALKERAELQKKKEKEKKEQEVKKKSERVKDSSSAFTGWKKKKDEELKNKAKKERKHKDEEETILLATQREKEEKAQQLYEDWMNKKQEKQTEVQHRKSQVERNLMEPRPAWSPASYIIPFGR